MFGNYLINKGIIDKNQLQKGLDLQTKIKKPIGEILADLGYLEKNNLDEYLNEFLSYEAEDLLSDETLWENT